MISHGPQLHIRPKSSKKQQLRNTATKMDHDHMNLRVIKKFTGAFILTLLFCCCSHYYYVPNVQNVPLFREKNQYRLSGSYGLGTETKCLEFQGAYSITDKLGIMTNFMSAKE